MHTRGCVFRSSHSWHAAALHLSHLLLHLHHVLIHGFLDFGIVLSHEVHDRLLEIVIYYTLHGKERVFDLGLFNEHVDHHLHFVTLALSGTALHFGLLFHGIHGQLL